MTAQATATKEAAPGEGLRLSRVGKRPVELPKGVTATIAQNKIEIKGPKGNLSRPLPPNVDVKIDAGKVTVQPTITGRDGARFQGLTRALIQSMATGAGTGYTRTLQLVGTGYRAEVKGPVLNLLLGFSHPIAFTVPAGIKIEVPGRLEGDAGRHHRRRQREDGRRRPRRSAASARRSPTVARAFGTWVRRSAKRRARPARAGSRRTSWQCKS